MLTSFMDSPADRLHVEKNGITALGLSASPISGTRYPALVVTTD